MRIIGGKYKGKSIRPPSGLQARPTTDFARESLFSVLTNHFSLEGASVADLFAGTGAMSYEFASRGATRIESVEKNRTHSRFIIKTMKQLQIEGMTVYPTDLRVYLRKAKGPFDILFADPPYELEWLKEIPSLVLSKNLLTPDGWFILEHGRDYDFSSVKEFRELRRYGNVHFSIFQGGQTEL